MLRKHGHEHGRGKMELPDHEQQKTEGTPLEIVPEKLAAWVLGDHEARVQLGDTWVALQTMFPLLVHH